MPKPFHDLTVDQFVDMLYQYPFRRRINAVHMHHTWRPNHQQFSQRRPLDVIEAMWAFHTQTNGWSDIAQHVTIDPRGMIWTGRDWNAAPASATGNNGTAAAGPFMFEMIGDFDKGRDPFADPQRAAALAVIAQVQHRFGLLPETLRFHNQMGPKTCPGSSINYLSIVEEVRALLKSIAAAPSSRSVSAFGDAASESRETTRKIVDMMVASTRGVSPSTEDELKEEDMDARESALAIGDAVAASRAAAGPSGASRSVENLTPAEREILRGHVVNLRLGALSEGGLFQSDPSDIDRIFGELLPAELAVRKAAGKKLHLLFFAHGGLVSEAQGLQPVIDRLPFYRNNGIYPIFFVWETGLKETVTDILKGMFGGRRDVGAATREAFTDPILEAVSRQGGLAVWSQMKRSAELAVMSGGGALLVAEKTRDFWAANHADMQIHAIGHSAGSIFHAYFLPSLITRKVSGGAPDVRVESLHFLAPASTSDLFKDKLMPLVGKGKAIANLTMYTMQRSFELVDTAGPYRKSLLYLVRNAFETVQPTPILGLEESIRQDSRLLRFFGLAGTQAPVAELLLSPTPDTASPRSSTVSKRHGDFDGDAKTMNSVARRILGAADDEAIFSFVDEGTRDLVVMSAAPEPAQTSPFAVTAALAPAPAPAASGPGRRRALCVGINAYPAPYQLSGCVGDAQNWAAAFGALGFEASLLCDAQATRAAILSTLTSLIRDSRPGDVIAFQYSGHGTQVKDLDGDEATDGKDEAMCPVDFSAGALLIDDDLRTLFASIPDGVSLTCLMDCCHSGSITRLVQGGPPADAASGKARFIPESDAVNAAHAQFRRALDAPPAAPPLASAEAMREVLFSACLDSEVAYEHGTAGDFTTRAVPLLRAGIGALTNEQFQQRILKSFGPQALQHPELDCASHSKSRGFLQPLTAGAGRGTGDDEILRRLSAIENRLSRLGV